MAERSQNTGVVFEFEREAMREEPVPEGLQLIDRILYIGLRYLYGSVRRGIVNKEAASSEKKQLAKTYHDSKAQLQFERAHFKWTAEFRKAVELAVSAYRKSPSIDAANKIVSVIDGIEFRPRLEAGHE